MLRRKIERDINQHFESGNDKVLIVEGARQVGKSFIIRKICKERFENYIELNFANDNEGQQIFATTKTTDDFYLQISILLKGRVGNKENTIIFLDEIQTYPHFLTMLKFLRQDARYTYIASGSLLGVTLKRTTSIPIGSIITKQMFPLDFEEFLWANGFNNDAINHLRECYANRQSLSESVHRTVFDLFKKYLLCGGLPDAVNEFVENKNIYNMRAIHSEISKLYGIDASKYDEENRLKIRRIYEMIPSFMENKKKRVVLKGIENKEKARFANYADEFDYLVSSGIALEVKAISNPNFPLIESSSKNLLKLYLNDVGLFSNILYRYNINAVINSENSINLGTLYECVVASELKAHGHNLFYYDNKANGEVDYLVDDFDTLSILPIEVKSGKDYTVHSALNHFVGNKDYHIEQAIVLSNEREVKQTDKKLF